MLKPYQETFIRLSLECKALQFGNFTLKSGRQSPYFFNAGTLYTGQAMNIVGDCYAKAFLTRSMPCDTLFGPAYKGIPLATSVAMALFNLTGNNAQLSFNRKEIKDHGEGGQLMGPPPKGRVVIVDDVITAGTAIREAVDLLTKANATPTAVLIGLDRQERGQGEQSAVQEVSELLKIPVISVIQLVDILAFLKQNNMEQTIVTAIESHLAQYGAGVV